MSDHESALIVNSGDGFMMHLYVQFLFKIIVHPEIMIAYKEMNGDARVSDLGDLSDQSDRSFWNGVLVFVPEIKKISYEINFLRVVPDAFKPVHDHFFSLQADLGCRHTKVKIGSEVYFFSRGQLRTGGCVRHRSGIRKDRSGYSSSGLIYEY